MLTAWDKHYEYNTNNNGLPVHYLPVPYKNEFSAWKRYKAFANFVWKASRKLKQFEHYDCIFATSTPLTVGIIALLARWFFDIRYLFEVRDLWPEAPIQLGHLSNPIAKKLAYSLEKLIYKQASGIVTLSPPNEVYISAKVEKPILVLPNLSVPTVLNEKDIEHEIIIGYFGTLGKANGLDKLLDLAAACQKQQKLAIHLKVAGEGALKSWFLDEMERRELRNITYLGYLQPEALQKVMQEIHFGYVSFRDEQILQHCSPNKFFDYLAAGVPVVLNYGGWLETLTLAQGAGLKHDTEAPFSLIDQLLNLAENKSEYKALKTNALSLSKVYHPSLAGQKLNHFLIECLAR